MSTTRHTLTDTGTDLLGRTGLLAQITEVSADAIFSQDLDGAILTWCSHHLRPAAGLPPLAAEFPDHVQGLQEEHRAIEDVLGEAADGVPSDPSWDRRLLAALGVLRAHVLKEQDGVFPAALSRLDPEDWDRVDEIRSEFVSRLSPAP